MANPVHPKKRVEIIVEAPLLKRLIGLIDAAGASGYTVMPTVAGRGNGGAWEAGNISGAFDRFMVLVIAKDQVAEAIVASAYDMLADYDFIVAVSDTLVVRGDKY